MAWNIIFYLLMSGGAEKKCPIHQWKVLKDGQDALAESTVHHVAMASAEG